MAQTIIATYNPASGKVTAKNRSQRVIIDGYETKCTVGITAALRKGAEALVSKLNADKGERSLEWRIIAEAEGLADNTATFIIEYLMNEKGDGKEYRVTWSIDVYARNHDHAAALVAENYFAQGCEGVFDVYDKDHADPVVVDLSKE